MTPKIGSEDQCKPDTQNKIKLVEIQWVCESKKEYTR